MFHHDVQIQVGKRNSHEHPMDRVLTGFNTPMKTSRTNKYRTEGNYIIQRQRVIRSFLNKSDENEPSIRKPTTLGATPKSLSITSISSHPILFADINDSSTNNNNRQQTTKKELEYQSPISIRRQRPTIENLSPIQQMSDIIDLSGNQLSIAIPSHFIFRNKPSRISLSDRSSSFKIDETISSSRIKPLNYSKTMNETIPKQTIFIPKLITQNASHSTHTWTAKLTDQNSTPTRTLVSTLHAKANILKRFKNHQRQSQAEKINHTPKTNYIQDLFISPRAIINPYHQEYDTNRKINKAKSTLYELGEDLKSSPYVISDEDEILSVDTCSSISKCTSQFDNSSAPISKPKVQRLSNKRYISRRKTYNHLLSPVVEYHDDDETGDEI